MQQEQEWSEVQTEQPEKEKVEFEIEKDEPKKEEVKQEVKAPLQLTHPSIIILVVGMLVDI